MYDPAAEGFAAARADNRDAAAAETTDSSLRGSLSDPAAEGLAAARADNRRDDERREARA